MVIWNHSTEVERQAHDNDLVHASSSTNDNNNSNNNDNERTPLLSSSTTKKESSIRKSHRGLSFTSGYEDPLQTKSALRLFIIHGCCYYTISIILFSFVLDTKWPILDSLYFATVVFTTIGYGDLYPQSGLGRLSTVFLALYGIVILGVFLGLYGESLLDSYALSEITQQTDVQAVVIENILHQVDHHEQENHFNNTNGLISNGSTTYHNNHAQNNNGVNNDVNNNNRLNGNNENTSDQITSPTTALDQPNNDIIQHSPKSTIVDFLQDVWSFAYQQTPILLVVMAVGVGIGHIEGWTITQSLYWTAVTGTTIGFGDEAPKTRWVRAISIFFLPFCVAVLGECLSRIAEIYIQRKRSRAQSEFFKRALTMTDLEVMDTNKDGHVTKAEFLCYMLSALQRVPADELKDLLDLFDRLDKDRTGVLNKNDLGDWNHSLQATLNDIAAVSLDPGATDADADDNDLQPSVRLDGEGGTSLTEQQRRRLLRASNIWRGRSVVTPLTRIASVVRAIQSRRSDTGLNNEDLQTSSRNNYEDP